MRGRRLLTVLTLTVASALWVAPTRAIAAPPRPTPGYWLVGADGGVFSFGAPFYGSGATVPGACRFSPQPPSVLNAAFGCDRFDAEWKRILAPQRLHLGHTIRQGRAAGPRWLHGLRSHRDWLTQAGKPLHLVRRSVCVRAFWRWWMPSETAMEGACQSIRR
jgi:hypothetical protein